MTQLREEVYFTKGRMIVRGKTVKRGDAKKADYLLYYKPGIPLAVIEAKDNTHSCAYRSKSKVNGTIICGMPPTRNSIGTMRKIGRQIGAGSTLSYGSANRFAHTSS